MTAAITETREKQYVDEKWNSNSLSVVAHCARRHEHYLAVRNNTTGTVSAVIDVVDVRRDGELSSRSVSESSESSFAFMDAPDSVLDALTTTSNENALTWRHRNRYSLV